MIDWLLQAALERGQLPAILTAALALRLPGALDWAPPNPPARPRPQLLALRSVHWSADAAARLARWLPAECEPEAVTGTVRPYGCHHDARQRKVRAAERGVLPSRGWLSGAAAQAAVSARQQPLGWRPLGL